MTKKKKVAPDGKYRYQSLSFKVAETSHQPQKSMPSNLEEEKQKFLKSGKTPKFQIEDPSKLAELASKTKNQIRFGLLNEAEYILEKVRDEYGEGEYFLEHMYGVRISKEEATPMLLSYIDENSLTESIKINWCDNMPCSAKMVWTGPGVNANKPELRKYSLWINGSDDNNYMREIGIKCLMDHELGTHFFRMVNDGFQPWFSDRSRFGLRSLGGFEGQCTEEGLASINTALRGRVKLLWSAALAYYTACKAAEMTFKQLFDHIGRYISNPDSRWKAVMRVKRGLTDPNDLGGFGNDQCYFEGAVNILRNLDKIDFNLLMSGKVCYDELDRIKRVVRKDAIKLPVFMKSMNSYLKSLKKMCLLNNLGEVWPQRSPPSAYLRRLDERKAEGTGARKPKKVRSLSKLKGNSALNKKQKGKVKDVRESEPDEEVQSFMVGSGRFENMQMKRKILREHEDEKLREENRVNLLVDSLKDQIKTIDGQLNKEISVFKDLVSEHSWSSLEYKESLLGGSVSEGSESDVQKPGELTDRTDVTQDVHKPGELTDRTDRTEGKKDFLYFKGEEFPQVDKKEDISIQEAKDWLATTTMATGNILDKTADGSFLCRGQTTVKERVRLTGHTRSASSLAHDTLCNSKLHKSKKIRRNTMENRSRKSTQLDFSEEHDSHGLVLEPLGEKVLSNSSKDDSTNVTMSAGDVFNNRKMNCQKQKQLLHPSVARLTTQDSLAGATQVDQIKNKLKILRKAAKLSEDDGKTSKLSGNSERIKRSGLQLNNLFMHKILNQQESSTEDLESLKAVIDAERDPCFDNSIATSNSLSFHQRPHRMLSFKHAQSKGSERSKPIPLYSDVTLAAVKLKATKEGSTLVAVEDLNQNINFENDNKLVQRKPFYSGSQLNRPKYFSSEHRPALISAKLKQKP